MASVNSSTSTTSTSAMSSSRITGLASGIDVDSMVDAMSMADKAKINKVGQDIQRNEWRTDAYRDLITKLSDFSSKYLSFSSEDNMRSATKYDTYEVTAKGDAASYVDVSVNGSAGAKAASNIIIQDISSVASAATFSSSPVAQTALKLSAAVADLKDQTIGFTTKNAEGQETQHILKFTSNTIDGAVDEINTELEGTGVSASYKDGKLTFAVQDENTITFDGVSKTLGNIFGIKAGDTAQMVSDTTTLTLAEDDLTNLNDQIIKISFDGNADSSFSFTGLTAESTIDDLKEQLNTRFTNEGIDIEASVDGNKLNITAKNGHSIEISTFSESAANAFEEITKNEGSEKYYVSASSNNTSSYEVNKSAISLASSRMIDAVADQSMTLEYNGISKKVTISADDINEYNYKVAAALDKKVAGEELTDEEKEFTSGYMSEDDIITGSIQYAIQKGIDRSFGLDSSGNSKINVGLDENNSITIETKNTTSTLKITDADTSLKNVFGIDTTLTNRLSTSDAVKDIDFGTELEGGVNGKYTFSVNDVDFTFSDSDNIDTILSKINKSDAGVTAMYSTTTNQFTFVAKDTGAQGKIDIKDKTGNLADALFGLSNDKATFTAGKDTVMSISFDGGVTFNDYERSTSKLNLDGMTLTLDDTVVGKVSKENKLSFGVKTDADSVVDKVKAMVEDYNTLIKEITTAVRTKPDADYEPLTDEQKDEMKDEQIEKWEEKAKVGILYNESELRNLGYELSQAVTSRIDGIGLPYDIGISSSSDYTKGIIINIDEDKLKAAVEEDPEKVMSIFTKSDEEGKGITERMKDVIDKYIGNTVKSNTYSRSRGVLVNKAGIADTLSATDNELNDQLKQLKEKLEKLNTKYDTKRDNLFKKFSYLEQFVSQQDSTLSWITGQLG